MTDTPTTSDHCAFVRSDGSHCSGRPAEEPDRALCFWHDPEVSKETDDVRKLLEAWADTGESMEGFILRYARLEGLHLSNRRSRDMRGAILFRANLQGSSLFNLDLREADLSKANLAGANLNESQMSSVNLLGANFDGTRLERVDWGGPCTNETAARTALREGRHDEASSCFEEAEEVYRILRRAYDGAGRFEQAGAFFRREMTMRRMLLPRFSGARFWSKLVDLFCAYGESPPRVILSATLLNVVIAFLFFFAGVNGPDGALCVDLSQGFWVNCEMYLNCLYYTVVTFTTLGYGEITPATLFTRHLASTHAFAGAFMMAMFVTVFGKKMTRG